MSPFYTRAARYCSSAERCPLQVKEHLLQWGADSSEADSVIDRLTKENFLNEERFCKAFVHDKVAYQGWGRRKIYAALQAFRLPSEAISSAILDIDPDTYLQQLRRLIKQKKGQPFEKVARFLLQRGFEYGEITSELNSKS